MHKEIFCFNSRGWVVLVQFQLLPVGGDDQTRASRVCSFMANENKLRHRSSTCYQMCRELLLLELLAFS